MANQLGKRYTCPECGSSVLCTKAGEGVINCCDRIRGRCIVYLAGWPFPTPTARACPSGIDALSLIWPSRS